MNMIIYNKTEIHREKKKQKDLSNEIQKETLTIKKMKKTTKYTKFQPFAEHVYLHKLTHQWIFSFQLFGYESEMIEMNMSYIIAGQFESLTLKYKIIISFSQL